MESISLKCISNKIAKNIGLIYRAKQLLYTSSLKSIYFSYIHTYVSYANIAWASTQKTKLKILNAKQKHAVRIIFNEDRLYHSAEYIVNLNFMHRLKK